MPPRLDCYFDYRSPFPYLAIAPVRELAARYAVAAEWFPIRLPGLSTYRQRPMGHTLTKRVAYVGIDMQRWARRRGLEIRTPEVLMRQVERPPVQVLGAQHPLDTERALRGALVAKRRGVFDAYHEAVSRALWGRGEDVARPDVLARAVAGAGLDADALLRDADADEVGAELDRLTQTADDRGVFGVPTFFVGDEMFWGQDRLDFVEEELARAVRTGG